MKNSIHVQGGIFLISYQGIFNKHHKSFFSWDKSSSKPKFITYMCRIKILKPKEQVAGKTENHMILMIPYNKPQAFFRPMQVSSIMQCLQHI